MELVFQVVQVPCDSVSQSSINFVSLSVCVCVLLLSCVQFFATLWTVAHQGSLSMDFSREEYWSGLPFPTPGDLPDQGIEPVFPVSCIGRCILYHCATWETHYYLYYGKSLW